MKLHYFLFPLALWELVQVCDLNLVFYKPSWANPKTQLSSPHTQATPMSSVRIHKNNQQAIYFLTFTVWRWYYLFDRHQRWEILRKSLQYCQQYKGLKIYAWVFMLNHIHLLVSAPELIAVVRDFKKFTSKELKQNILATEPSVLKIFEESGKYAFWQPSNMPKPIESEAMFYQKQQYIENNPVAKQYVKQPADWIYSSANQDGLLVLDKISWGAGELVQVCNLNRNFNDTVFGGWFNFVNWTLCFVFPFAKQKVQVTNLNQMKEIEILITAVHLNFWPTISCTTTTTIPTSCAISIFSTICCPWTEWVVSSMWILYKGCRIIWDLFYPCYTVFLTNSITPSSIYDLCAPAICSHR